ncbi:uncharacterized protein LOC111920888 [Lactuca sativa]|uniref:uncharacterized protein LOC111920888 n=1 Tax=Lactuca sativa TaxID=4236 RepID=UPI0022AF1E27|nr:uncharacterized protein LOC111920888 [Lactuca sativa]
MTMTMTMSIRFPSISFSLSPFLSLYRTRSRLLPLCPLVRSSVLLSHWAIRLTTFIAGLLTTFTACRLSNHQSLSVIGKTGFPCNNLVHFFKLLSIEIISRYCNRTSSRSFPLHLSASRIQLA